MSALRKALVKALSEIRSPGFDRVNTAFGARGFRYASLAAFADAARDALGRNGLAMIQPIFPMHADGRVVDAETGSLESPDAVLVIRTRVIHESGEELELGAFPFRPEPKPQSVGGTITYFRRYSLAAALGIVADEDNDGNDAETKPARKVETLPPKTRPAEPSDRLGTVKAGQLVQRLRVLGIPLADVVAELSKDGVERGSELAAWPATDVERIRDYLATRSPSTPKAPEVIHGKP
jgi:predicted flap endonuclease-1-like 5' DNA nuclease